MRIDPHSRTGWFKLDQHENVNKGIKARGKLADKLVDYVLSIWPANAHGLIHPNPATGKPYVDIRKQWNRLINIASRILGYELTAARVAHGHARQQAERPDERRSHDGGTRR